MVTGVKGAVGAGSHEFTGTPPPRLFTPAVLVHGGETWGFAGTVQWSKRETKGGRFYHHHLSCMRREVKKEDGSGREKRVG